MLSRLELGQSGHLAGLRMTVRQASTRKRGRGCLNWLIVRSF